MAKEINYVVGCPWNDDRPNDLSIYTYGSEIQRGTMKDAENFLAYVKRSSTKSDKNAIYVVTFTKVE